MSILFGHNQCWPWSELFQQQLPEHRLIYFEDLNQDRDVAAINYAVVWKHPAGDLQRYPNLKFIFCLGAGVDHLTKDTDLPKLPLIRLHDPAMAEDMARYCLYWLFDIQYQFSAYRQQQQQRLWQAKAAQTKQTRELTVGIMGLGNIGTHLAQRLRQNHFKVLGYARKARHQADYFYAHQLAAFLSQTNVLINCLPLTPATENLLNQERLNQLPKGSHLINISRGGIVVDADLIQALNTKQLASAVLDVCRQEPLAADHPFWKQANLHLTPHISGVTNPYRAVNIIANNIRHFEQGGQLDYLVDFEQGY